MLIGQMVEEKTRPQLFRIVHFAVDLHFNRFNEMTLYVMKNLSKACFKQNGFRSILKPIFNTLSSMWYQNAQN